MRELGRAERSRRRRDPIAIIENRDSYSWFLPFTGYGDCWLYDGSLGRSWREMRDVLCCVALFCVLSVLCTILNLW